MIEIDQSPIGRTPRSNPATYTGVFTPIRDLFAMLPESRERGYKPGRFSFNVKGGRCEACQGDGMKRIEMNFLPDVYVTCDVCRGTPLQPRDTAGEIQGLLHRGPAGSDGGRGAAESSRTFRRFKSKLQTLVDVGLGYIHLGQSSTTLSGGEAQRIKLAKELSSGRPVRRSTFWMSRQPDCISKMCGMLLDVLQRLVDLGNTVLVIEHHLDVIKTADWIIDLGPEGGEQGGHIVATGTPEEIMQTARATRPRIVKKTHPPGESRLNDQMPIGDRIVDTTRRRREERKPFWGYTRLRSIFRPGGGWAVCHHHRACFADSSGPGTHKKPAVARAAGPIRLVRHSLWRRLGHLPREI